LRAIRVALLNTVITAWVLLALILIGAVTTLLTVSLLRGATP
jgi:hypothetical protein